MKKQFLRLVVLTMLFLLGVGYVQAETVTWALSVNRFPSPLSGTGFSSRNQITNDSTNTLRHYNYAGYRADLVQGAQRVSGSTAALATTMPGAYNVNNYLEYTITATTGYNLSVSEIGMSLGAGGTTSIKAAIYYSTNNFSTSYSLVTSGSPLSLISNTSTVGVVPYSYNATKFNGGVNIPVLEGSTLKVRVYSWNTGTGTGKYIISSNAYISFSVSPTCISPGITSITAPSTSLCSTATQTLTATGVLGTNAVVNWYTATGGGGTYLGAGTTLPAVGPGTYYARVSADCGTPVEAFITVATLPNVSIETQPIAASYAQYVSASALSIGASGGGLVYQWYSSTDNSNATSGNDLAVGTNSASFTPPTTTLGTLYYYCLANGTCSSLASNPVAIEITVGTSPSLGLTGGAASQTVSAGDAISDITYSWGGTAITAAFNWSGSSSITPTGINEEENGVNKTVLLFGTPSEAGTYDYVVQSNDGALSSGTLTGTLTVKLATPSISAATTPTNQGFTANWSDVSNENGYTLNVYQGATLALTDNTIAANTTSKVVTGLNPNTTYTYKVIANGNGGLVPSSNESAASASVRTKSVLKAITAFALTGQVSSSINEEAKTILVYIPQGTDKSSLTSALITLSDYASVLPASGASQNFTSPVEYTVTAEDGGTQVYTVTADFGSSLTDHFRSKATGNWSDASTWESSIDNTTWMNATTAPASTALSASIEGGFTVTVNTAITIPATTVASGSILKATAQPTLGSTLIVNGTYDHNFNGGSLPIATWNTGSMCKVTGVTSSGVSGTTQNFYHFTWDCPAQTVASLVLFGVQTFNGNLTINSTNNTLNRLTSIALADQTYIMTINGNFTVGSTASLTSNGSSRGGTDQFDIGGDLIVNGTLNGNNSYAASYAVFNVAGNVYIGAAGVLTKGATGGTTLKFTKAGTQTYTKASATVLPAWDIVVNSGSILNVSNQLIDGTPTFTLSSGATLQTSLQAGVNGNLTTSGTKTISPTASYIFDGASAQVSGTLVTSASSISSFNSSGLTLSANTTTSSLIIGSGAAVTVSPAKQLTVSTTLSNSGTLNVLSDANGSGSLLTPTVLSGTGGTYNVQQYLTGGVNLESAPNGRFWYVSSPVSGAYSSVFNPASGNKLWSFTESTCAYTAVTDGLTELTVGKGYVARMVAATPTVQFTGAPNNGEVILNITRNGPTNTRGFDLIGNPYPSYLDFKNAVMTDMWPSAWFRTATTLGDAMVFDTYNASTDEATGNGVRGMATRYIAPMQAFWVKAHYNGVTGHVTFNNALRSHQTTNLLKSAETAVEKSVVRLQVSNGTNIDQAVLAFMENASDALDAYDSEKMFNNVASIPEIYSLAGSSEVTINGMSPFGGSKTLALGFKTAQAGTFSIQANDITNVEGKVTLIDNLLKVSQNLVENPIYTFNSEVVSGSDRFVVVIEKMPTSLINTKKVSVMTFAREDGRIQVETSSLGNNQASISVYSVSGQLLTSAKTNTSSTILKMKLKPGLYMVNVSAEGLNTTQKVIIN